jgi:hypothetical protein
MAVMDLMRRIERMGINIDINNKPLVLSEQEQIRDYIKSNPRLDGSYIDVTRDSYTTSTSKNKEDDLNDAPQ